MLAVLLIGNAVFLAFTRSKDKVICITNGGGVIPNTCSKFLLFS